MQRYQMSTNRTGLGGLENISPRSHIDHSVYGNRELVGVTGTVLPLIFSHSDVFK